MTIEIDKGKSGPSADGHGTTTWRDDDGDELTLAKVGGGDGAILYVGGGATDVGEVVLDPSQVRGLIAELQRLLDQA